MPKAHEILVAEDAPTTAESIKNGLERRGEFVISMVMTGQEALRYIAASVPDALLLDTTLPDLSTSEMCRVIRSRERSQHLPCILLGERSRGIGMVGGLNLGADDYLTKPVNPDELEARLNAILRRRRVRLVRLEAERFRGVHLDIDFTNVSVVVNSVPVSLTRRELALLRVLINGRNQVQTRQALLINVWGSDNRDPHIVDSAMWKLRTKLRRAGEQIETIVGFGYRFSEPEK